MIPCAGVNQPSRHPDKAVRGAVCSKACVVVTRVSLTQVLTLIWGGGGNKCALPPGLRLVSRGPGTNLQLGRRVWGMAGVWSGPHVPLSRVGVCG